MHFLVFLDIIIRLMPCRQKLPQNRRTQTAEKNYKLAESGKALTFYKRMNNIRRRQSIKPFKSTQKSSIKKQNSRKYLGETRSKTTIKLNIFPHLKQVHQLHFKTASIKCNKTPTIIHLHTPYNGNGNIDFQN